MIYHGVKYNNHFNLICIITAHPLELRGFRVSLVTIRLLEAEREEGEAGRAECGFTLRYRVSLLFML
jgi:hypothetical protein